MAIAIELAWTRCPDGVEVVDYGTLPRRRAVSLEVKSGQYFRRSSSKHYVFEHQLNLRKPLVSRFINSRTDKALSSLFRSIGLPSSSGGIDEVSKASVLVAQGRFADLYHRTAGGRNVLADINAEIDAEAEKEVQLSTAVLNKIVDWNPSVHLRPYLYQAPRAKFPSLTLRPATLYGFMLMELVVMVSGCVRLHTCEQCAAAFATGAGTGRRGRSKYCSDRCRQAAYRERQKGS